MIYKAKTFYKGRMARDYDKERFSSLKGKLYNWFEKRSITKALKCFSKYRRILDIPCGSGRITEHIIRLGFKKVEGTDISDDMLSIARTRLPNTFFYKSDIETICNHRNMYKLYSSIVSVRFMGHLPYPQKIKALNAMKYISTFQIITFYHKKWYKPTPKNWYPIEEKELEHLFEVCKLTPLYKYPVCLGWSDGTTYLLVDKNGFIKENG
jgi:SAM-dependent methyltransferase